MVTTDGLANDVVYSIAGAENDELWLGRQQGGLTRLSYSGNSFTAKTYTQADGLAQNRVSAVYRSRDGTVWSGTLNSGVSELKNGHFTNYTTTDGLASNTISSIVEGSDGTMWFGHSERRQFDVAEAMANLMPPKTGCPPSRMSINCLLQGAGNILWVGTAGGLCLLQ